MEAEFTAHHGDLDDAAEAAHDALLWALNEIGDENLRAYLPEIHVSFTLPQPQPPWHRP